MSTRIRPRSPWTYHLAAGVVAGGAYLVVPALHRGWLALGLLGLYALGGLVVGIVLERPRHRLPWICFTVGLGLFWLGGLDAGVAGGGPGHEMPLLSVLLALAAYVSLLIGLSVVSRRRNPSAHHSALVDALIVTLGLALIPGLFVIAPAIDADTLDSGTRAMLIGHAVGDLLLLGATVRLALDGGRRWASLRLLSGSVIALLVTDFTWGLLRLDHAYHGQAWLGAGRFAFYLLWAAAALHPSMAKLSEPAPGAEQRLTAMRLGLLSGATLISPALVIVRTSLSHDWEALAS
ncbi:MAG: hypothetical protein ACYC0H_02665, partial [Solirubrobacteraceae bacterium]